MKKIIVVVSGLMIMIAACKKEKTETPTPTPAPTVVKVTYTADIKAITSTRCAVAGCHVANAQFPDFTTYASVKSNISMIIDRMGRTAGAAGFMPNGGTKVQADVDKMTQWKTDGLLEQ